MLVSVALPEIFEEPEEQIRVTVGTQEPVLMSLQD
jgi:hypothetical protein